MCRDILVRDFLESQISPLWPLAIPFLRNRNKNFSLLSVNQETFEVIFSLMGR